jgi:capsular exopolysaccharide synthesis family protein
MNDRQTNEYIDLREIARALFRHVRIILLTGLLFGAAGFFYWSFGTVPLYESSAMMIVNPGKGDSLSSDQINSAQKLVETYSVILTSDRVTGQVAADLGMEDTYASRVSEVEVSAVNGTQIMEITVAAADPETARAVCDEITRVAPEIVSGTVRAGSLELISRATVPEGPVSADAGKHAGKAAVIGSFLAALAVALGTLAGGRIKNAEDIRREELTLLGTLPPFAQESRRRQDDRKLRLFYQKGAPPAFSEACRELGRKLAHLAETEGIRTILVTGALPGEGRTTLSLNLAFALAESGKKVALADCDMRKGSVASLLKAGRNAPGLTDVLAGRKELKEVLLRAEPLKTDILLCGPLPPDPAGTVGSRQMAGLLRELSEEYDLVILDSPPASGIPDAAVLSRYADGCLLTARAGVTTRQALHLARKNLEEANAGILGAVLNGYDAGNRRGRKK